MASHVKVDLLVSKLVDVEPIYGDVNRALRSLGLSPSEIRSVKRTDTEVLQAFCAAKFNSLGDKRTSKDREDDDVVKTEKALLDKSTSKNKGTLKTAITKLGASITNPSTRHIAIVAIGNLPHQEKRERTKKIRQRAYELRHARN